MAYRSRFLLLFATAAAVGVPAPALAGPVPEVALDGTLPVESSGHLDQFFRRRGFQAYREGSLDWARRYFEFAAAHADKTSQFAIAALHRNGEGVPRDPAAAYAWLDLAAERGYPAFLAEREAVWEALDPVQRERAVDLTTQLYAKYGDAVAKRRHADNMTRYLKKSIARHPSLAGGHIITIDATCAGATRGTGLLPGGGCRDDDYFTPERFDPKAYWATQDDLWMPRGEVVVQPLQVPPTRARPAAR